jgi:hypothetical protein
MYMNEAECEAAGLDPKEVERIARGLSRYARQAEAMGLVICGGSGSSTLRYDDGGSGRLLVAKIDGNVDGGDGTNPFSNDGLLRGE